VKSVPAGIERVTRHRLEVRIAELDALFGVGEELVGVGLVPSYRRQTFLP